MKIKYGHRQKRTGNMGAGAVFDFDWEITIIDKTTRPHKKKTISRTDMIGNTLSVIKDIDNYIEYNFCVGITKYWNSDINKQHRKDDADYNAYLEYQEENISIKNRVKELEDISKAHQKQNGDMQTKLADSQTIVNLQADRIKSLEDKLNMFSDEINDFRVLCHILKVSNFFENIRATQMKQAKDIVDINYVA